MAVLVGLEVDEIREVLGSSVPGYRARQVYGAVYRERVPDLMQVSSLPLALRRQLTEQHALGLPKIARRFDSRDGTTRYLLELADGETVETVLMPEEERDTVCISTQVGCPVNCRFCMTALLGLERNLSAGEITGQVLLTATGRPLNVVMMGQGEPLLNLPNVLKATRLLTDSDGIGIPPRRITVSTSGIIPKIEELGKAEVRPKLAISLNASTEEMRRELMPITRKYHLKDLLDACRNYPLRPWERLTFEYVLLRGVNDSDADARRVVGLLGQLKAKVNLIALNPGPEIPFESPEPGRVEAFQNIVRRSLPCFVRKPRGLDVFAACGQLRRMVEKP